MEMAVVGPLFLFVLFTVMEFGHFYLTVNLLNGAAERAARLGITEGVTTAEVSALATDIVSAALPSSSADISVRDGSVFDELESSGESGGTEEPFDPTEIDYDGLQLLELANADERQLFVVRVEVDYADVGIVGPYFLSDLTLVGQSVMRHE